MGPALLLALVSIGVFVWIVTQRAGHPFELEWMEGGSLQHLMRIVDGRALYGAPALDFVAYPYPPVYYYAAIPFASVLGDPLLALRVVSILSSLGSAFLLYSLIRLETRRSDIAFIGAGLFLATYRISGAYMDVARLDALFVVLVLASVWLLRRFDGTTAWMVAGVLAALAIGTKQTGLAVFAPLFVGCVYRDYFAAPSAASGSRRTIAFIGTSAVLVVATVLLLICGENDHFLDYVMGTQSGHEIRWWMIPSFFGKDLFLALPLGCVVIGLWLWRSNERETVWFYVALLLGIIAACIVPRIKVGGAMNNLILLHAGLVLLSGIALGKLLELTSARSVLVPMVGFGLVAQFLWLGFDPRIVLPNEGDAAAGGRLVKQLRMIRGEVLIPAHGYLAARAGKQVFAHQMPVDDMDNSRLAVAASLRRQYAEAIAAQRFALIVDSASRFLERYPDDQVLSEHYKIRGPVFEKPGVLVPRSGWQVGPGRVWVPRAESRTRASPSTEAFPDPP